MKSILLEKGYIATFDFYHMDLLGYDVVKMCLQEALDVALNNYSQDFDLKFVRFYCFGQSSSETIQILRTFEILFTLCYSLYPKLLERCAATMYRLGFSMHTAFAIHINILCIYNTNYIYIYIYGKVKTIYSLEQKEYMSYFFMASLVLTILFNSPL
jgi:hypothetical protein